MRVWPAKDCGRDTHGDYRFLYSTAGTLFLTKNLDYAFSHKTYSDSPSFKGEKRSKQESRNKSTFMCSYQAPGLPNIRFTQLYTATKGHTPGRPRLDRSLGH